MPDKAPAPFGPGRWIRWVQGPFWLLLAVAALVLAVQHPSPLHTAMACAFAVFGVFWTWLMLRERAIMRWDAEHPDEAGSRR